METAIVELTATALAEGFFPQVPTIYFPRGRPRLTIALLLVGILILFYLLRNLCRNWCRHTPPHVLSSWDRFTVVLYESDFWQDRDRRHNLAVKQA